MTTICLTPDVLSLNLSPADKILLAYVCQRAVLRDDQCCTDTNNELAQATHLHPPTLYRLIGQLETAGHLTSTVDASQGNRRSLKPSPALLMTYTRSDAVSVQLNKLTVKPYTPGVDTPSPRQVDTLPTKSKYPALQNVATPDESPQKVDTPAESPIVAQLRPVRHCPVTGIDVTHQPAVSRLATTDTLEELFKRDRPRFDELVDRFMSSPLTGVASTWPYFLGKAIREYEQRHPSRPAGLRHCPVTGIDVSNQGAKFPLVTMFTIRWLCQTDWERFAQVLVDCGLSALLSQPVKAQCAGLKAYVDQQAAALDTPVAE